METGGVSDNYGRGDAADTGGVYRLFLWQCLRLGDDDDQRGERCPMSWPMAFAKAAETKHRACDIASAWQLLMNSYISHIWLAMTMTRRVEATGAWRWR